MNSKPLLAGALGLVLAFGLWFSATVSHPAQAGGPPKDPGKVTWAPAVKPKPLSKNVQSALSWIVKHQHQNGGWGQGEESQEMGGGQPLAEVPNVADTCISTLALIRSGSSPGQGAYAQSIRRGVGFVCTQVEGSDVDSMLVSKVQGTRVQMKLGPHIDTFLAAMVLAEVKGKMPEASDNKRVEVCLNKVLKKVQKNQKADGTWTNEGWAPVLAQSMASKGLNRAAQAGAPVDQTTLTRADEYSSKNVGKVSEGSAGVALYSASSTMGTLQDSVNTQASREKELKDRAQNAPSKTERDDAKKQLDRLDGTRKAQQSARKAVVGRLSDPGFVSGFGSNGGEEFLSYMNISESLVVKGGPEWQKWDAAMLQNLSRIQNPDGSWTGHHCITGRNFCTAAALLVLTADRAPVPLTVR